MTSAEAKKELRRTYSAARRALTAAYRESASRAIRERIRASAFYRAASDVVLFAADAVEPSLLELIALDRDSKRFHLPRYVAEKACYTVARVTDVAELAPGKYGIPEPSAKVPETEKSIARTALYLVPAVAFDAAGNRLGRGKGFYDRLLAEAVGPAVGVLFDCQQAPALVAEPHDRVLDAAVTETRIVFFTQRSNK